MAITLDHLRRYAVARSLFKPTTLSRAIQRTGSEIVIRSGTMLLRVDAEAKRSLTPFSSIRSIEGHRQQLGRAAPTFRSNWPSGRCKQGDRVSCVFDLNEFWSALGAISTVVTGGAAVYVAKAAYRLSSSQDTRNEQRSRRANKAFSVLAVTELFARRATAEVLHQNLSDVLTAPGAIALLRAVLVIEQSPTLQISERLITSPSLGDLPEGIPQELAGVYSSSVQLPVLLGLALVALKNTQLADGDAFEHDRNTLTMARDGLATFLAQLNNLVPKLHELAKPVAQT